MTLRLLWFVLAGFLLGFAASTLWEWLHFRRERMKLRDRRVRELEGQLHDQKRMMSEGGQAVAPFAAVRSQPQYHSPGVFLDSEAPEATDYAEEPELATPGGEFASIPRARETVPKAVDRLVKDQPSRVAPERADVSSPVRVEPPVRLTESLERLAASLSSRVVPVEALPGPNYRKFYQERPADYPDDLSRIKGIGDVYKWRLYKAGIFTWHQIAESDEATLRAATNAYPSSNVDEWREQARLLAAKNGRQNAVYHGAQPDDLVKIVGIGPVGARTLYRAGICTFEQLAGATPEELHELFPIAIAGDEPDFSHWIAQAVELASKKSAG